MNETRNYGMGTELTQRFPWGTLVGGRALCSDGKVRALKRISSTADTFFSVPASVEVRMNGERHTVAGYITTETAEGFSTETESDPAVIKFVAYQYRKNGDKLPRGKFGGAS